MQRGQYLLRKTAFALITLVVVVIFNFFLFRIIPGDPIAMMLHNTRLDREAKERVRADFGLDKPTWIDIERLKEGDLEGAFDSQFFTYIANTAKGNFGISFTHRSDVRDLLSERIWRTLVLVVGGELLAIVFGIILGLIAAWRRGTRLDAGILVFALFSWALPTFFLGIIMLLVFRGNLPVGGMVTPGLKPEHGWEFWKDVGRHLILPTITLAVVHTGEYILIMRSSILEVLTEDFILTAKAKGLNTFQIFRDHALKNAMLPMVTIIALTLGFTVGGAIQVETVFSWPGIGRLMFEAVAKRDYPLLQGTFLLLAASVIAANFLAEVLYSVLDPRVKND